MKALRIVGIALAGLVFAAVALYAWASHAASQKLYKRYTAHTVDFPIPFPANQQQVRSNRPGAEQRVWGRGPRPSSEESIW